MLLPTKNTSSLLLLLLVAIAATTLPLVESQYACTLAAPKDEGACIQAVGDDQEHCAWCSLSSFGFCVSQVQAAQFEQSIPGIKCDRYSVDDDDAAVVDDDGASPGVDDDTAANDDAPDDDGIIPSDDTVPDDFWTCLQAKDEAACGKDAGCTWCMSKVGFGLCMAGPTADSAANSNWFTCAPKITTIAAPVEPEQDPYDPSCITAYLSDPTQSGCESAADEDGNPCQWCNLAGMADVCLTAEQAADGAQLGLTCDDDNTIVHGVATAALTTRREESSASASSIGIQDPLDMTCILAFLQSPTEVGCTSAVDQDGAPCEYCSYPGMGSMCLNADQADAGATIGITCETFNQEEKEDEEEESFTVAASLYDSACLMAYLQDPSAGGCAGALDQDGTACAYCAYPGIGSVCLTSSQVDMISQLGIECGRATSQVTENTHVVVQGSPSDAACIVAFLQNQSEEACTSAVDSDGVACEWCNYQGLGNMCLTTEQGEIASQLGVSCDSNTDSDIAVGAGALNDNADVDPSDTSCIMAFLQDQSEQGCTTAVDMDGAACEWCSYQGLGNLCLTEVQAGMAEQVGVTCDASNTVYEQQDEDDIVQDDPYGTACALSFFENMSKETCISTVDEEGEPCQYCVMDGALTLCFNQQQADIAEGLGFACSSERTEAVDEDLYDKSCIMAFMEGEGTQDACTQAVDEDGGACKWCHVAGVADVCLTATQGDMATQLGVWCDGSDEIAFKPIVKEEDKVDIPDDFFECLEHYQEGDCNQSSCTWCNTDVGMGFCMADAAARALKECDFFQCDYKKAAAIPPVRQLDPYDPVCLTAGMQNQDDAEDVCNGTMDSDGSPCVWCDAAGVFGLCMSSEQASMAGQFLECDNGGAVKIA